MTRADAYFVLYEVNGYAGEFKAGPYRSASVAVEHKDDIVGFEGVVNARVSWEPQFDWARGDA